MRKAIKCLVLGLAGASLHVHAAVYDVLNYGAIPDDALEDTTAIQSALDAADAAGGGVVKVPSGVYIAANLKIGDRVSIRGEGRGVSVLQLAANTNSGKAILANTDKNNGNVLIGIYDLSFNGDQSNQTNTTHGLRLENANEVTIAGCEFYDCKYYGVFAKECSALVMQNCFAFGNLKTGYQLTNQSEMRLIACEAMNNSLSGFVINYSSWSTLVGCHALDNSVHGFNMGSVDNMSISGCRASANGSDGFTTWAPGTNNEYMTFNGVSSGNNSSNGFNLNSIQNTTLNHCHAMSNAENGVSISTSTGKDASKSLTWQGGVISENSQHGVLVKGAQQFILGGAVICDNSATSAGLYDGVRITDGGGVDSERIKIAGCVIRNTQSTLFQNYAINASSATDHVYVYTSDVTNNVQSAPINILATNWDTDLNQGE